MPVITEVARLTNGVEIPRLGFGTWQIPDGDDTYSSVSAALASGYRHIDTARDYGNEESVGRAVRESGIPRDQIFVTTKLPSRLKDYDWAHASFKRTATSLDLGYVDLYLIHAPWPWGDMGQDCTSGNIAAWRAMEEVLASGETRAIGVSNFSPEDLDSLTAATTVVPMVNQIRYYIGHTQQETIAYCDAHGILVEGYSPLATGRILDDPDVTRVAASYGKSVAQLCIRYLLERGLVALPKSTTPARIVENADVDFTISTEDLDYLDGLEDAAR